MSYNFQVCAHTDAAFEATRAAKREEEEGERDACGVLTDPPFAFLSVCRKEGEAAERGTQRAREAIGTGDLGRASNKMLWCGKKGRGDLVTPVNDVVEVASGLFLAFEPSGYIQSLRVLSYTLGQQQ